MVMVPVGPINTPRNFSISSGLPFLCSIHYHLSASEVRGTRYTLRLITIQRALLCTLSSQQFLLSFMICTSKSGDFRRVVNEGDFNEQLIIREFFLQAAFFIDLFQLPDLSHCY